MTYTMRNTPSLSCICVAMIKSVEYCDFALSSSHDSSDNDRIL